VELQIERGAKWTGVVSERINDKWQSFTSLHEAKAPAAFLLFGAMGVRSFKRRCENKLLKDDKVQWQIVAMLATARRRKVSSLYFYVIPSTSSSADDIKLVMSGGVAKIPADGAVIDKDRVGVLRSLAAAWNKKERNELIAAAARIKPEPVTASSGRLHYLVLFVTMRLPSLFLFVFEMSSLSWSIARSKRERSTTVQFQVGNCSRGALAFLNSLLLLCCCECRRPPQRRNLPMMKKLKNRRKPTNA
jgi:hypothetical protein